MYNDSTLVVRVWDLNDGVERTVSFSDSASAYFSGATQDTIEQVTIADYTLLTNTSAEITMNTDTSADLTKQALVTIEQVAYNTNYSIDLAKDGVTTPSKVYSATKIEVVPGSYEKDDGGACSDVDAQTFSVDSGSKTGLGFRLINQCQPYLVGGNTILVRVGDVSVREVPPALVTGGEIVEQYDGFQVRWRDFGSAGAERLINIQVQNASWQERSFRTGQTVSGNQGGKVEVKEEEVKQESDARYMSRHKVDVQLINGGVGWRKGDIVGVTMAGKNYTVHVLEDRFTYAYNSAGTASYTTPVDTSGGTLDVGSVVASLVSGINAITNFSAQSVGNVILIKNTAGRDFNLGVRGGVTDNAMTAIKGLARDVADLPTQCFDGYTLMVNNTDDSDADDYWVKFTTEAPGIPGAGSWQETVAPSIKTTLNSSTMPHALVRQADGSFLLDALNSESAFGGWASREVGDELTNPEPSFVGRTISNLFFFANRLGFLSEDAVIMSQPGDYFNFFVTSAIAISDADPIDITASSTIPAILKAAVGTPKGLILFAERSQFLLATSEIAFSTATVKLTEISNYFYRSRVLPLNSGVSVSFISESTSYSKVMEMAVDSVENRPAVADITRIIPQYLPSNLNWGEVFPNNNLLAYGDGSADVYTFKFFNNGDERQLAGWTKWTYPAKVKLFASEDDTIHIVQYDGEKHILTKSELTDDPDGAPLNVGFSRFYPRVDASLEKDALTITPLGGKESSVGIPAAKFIKEKTYTYTITDGPSKGSFYDFEPTYDSGADEYIFTVPDSVVEFNGVVGVKYISSVVLPAIFVTAENRADRVYVPQVSFLYLDLYYSGRYKVTIDKIGYDPKVYDIEVTPANSYRADDIAISEISTESIPVFSSGDILNITIEAPDPFPSALTGYSWEGTYNNRGISPLR